MVRLCCCFWWTPLLVVASGFLQPSNSHLASSSLNSLRIASPLVEDGVVGREDLSKPLLLYCPGLDGTRVSGFLQLPKLGELFDVRVLEASGDDRSNFESVVDFAWSFVAGQGRPFYLLGESFGSLVALRVNAKTRARGTMLVNPATSYRRSSLRKSRDMTSFFRGGALDFVLDLALIVSGFYLPPSIDTPAREAYMGRSATTLWPRLSAVDSDAVEWRLREWLEVGTEQLVMPRPDDQVLVIVGENDATLPSVEEARTVFEHFPSVVVPGASHGTTLGTRCDLAALARAAFFQQQPRSPSWGLVRRRHPRVDPRDYESYRVPVVARVCVGPDCLKDGAGDVIGLLKKSQTAQIQTIDCRGLCGDGPVVQIDTPDKMPRLVSKIDSASAINEISRTLGVVSPTLSPSEDRVISSRQGPLDLDRTKRVLLQRAVWFAIILAVSQVEQAREGGELLLFPDRFLVAAAFLASLYIVPENFKMNEFSWPSLSNILGGGGRRRR